MTAVGCGGSGGGGDDDDAGSGTAAAAAVRAVVVVVGSVLEDASGAVDARVGGGGDAAGLPLLPLLLLLGVDIGPSWLLSGSGSGTWVALWHKSGYVSKESKVRHGLLGPNPTGPRIFPSLSVRSLTTQRTYVFRLGTV